VISSEAEGDRGAAEEIGGEKRRVEDLGIVWRVEELISW